MPSGHLPPTAFVLFLQNHDQIGNRAFGERLTTLADPAALEAAIALLLLSPQIPLLFMGEEDGESDAVPVLYRPPHGTWPMRCAKDGATSSRNSPHSPMPPPANAFPTRMRRKPSTPRSRMPTLQLGPAREALYRRLIDLRASGDRAASGGSLRTDRRGGRA